MYEMQTAGEPVRLRVGLYAKKVDHGLRIDEFTYSSGGSMNKEGRAHVSFKGHIVYSGKSAF